MAAAAARGLWSSSTGHAATTRACLPAMPDIAGLTMGIGGTGMGTTWGQGIGAGVPLGNVLPVPNIVPGVMCGE